MPAVGPTTGRSGPSTTTTPRRRRFLRSSSASTGRCRLKISCRRWSRIPRSAASQASGGRPSSRSAGSPLPSSCWARSPLSGPSVRCRGRRVAVGAGDPRIVPVHRRGGSRHPALHAVDVAGDGDVVDLRGVVRGHASPESGRLIGVHLRTRTNEHETIQVLTGLGPTICRTAAAHPYTTVRRVGDATRRSHCSAAMTLSFAESDAIVFAGIAADDVWSHLERILLDRRVPLTPAEIPALR